MGNPCASPVEWDDEQLTLPMDKSRCFTPQPGKIRYHSKSKIDAEKVAGKSPAWGSFLATLSFACSFVILFYNRHQTQAQGEQIGR